MLLSVASHLYRQDENRQRKRLNGGIVAEVQKMKKEK